MTIYIVSGAVLTVLIAIFLAYRKGVKSVRTEIQAEISQNEAKIFKERAEKPAIRSYDDVDRVVQKNRDNK